MSHERPASMQSRLYQLTCLLVSILCTIVIVPLDLIQGLPLIVTITDFMFGLLSLFFYRESKRGRDHIVGYFFLLLVVLNISWFPNGGSEGSTIFYFAAGVIYPIVLLRGTARWAFFSLLIMNACSLYVLEYFFPTLVEPFHSPSERLIDLLTGIFCSTLAGALSLWVVITNYDREHALITSVSRKLEESEKRYREVVENTNAVILRLDPSGAITFFNAFAERLFGYRREEAIGKKITEVIAPAAGASDLDLDRMVREIAARPERYAYFETESICRDGKHVWTSWANQPVMDSSNRLIEVLCVGSDLTERKRMATVVRHSEHQLQTILDHTPAVVTLKDREYRYKLINRRFEDLHNVSDDVVQDKNDYDLFPLQIATALRNNDRMVLETKQPLQFDEIMPHDGGLRHYLSVKFPLMNMEGDIQGLCSISMDVTERKRADEALVRSEQRFRDLLERVNLVAVMLDRHGAITYCNDYLLKITGWSQAEVLRKNWFDLFIPPEARESVSHVHRANIATGANLHHEHPILTRAGNRRLLVWDSVIMHDLEGAVTGVARIGMDITEHSKLEEQLRQSQKMEAIGYLAGGVAHDFNNILTAIIGYGNLIKMNLDPSSPAYTFAEQILASSERASNLTNSLLAYSRKQVIEPKPLDINAVVSGLQKILDRIIGEDIELGVELYPRPLVIQGDKNQLEQVMMNLVANARDAMAMGGRLTITVHEFTMDDQFIRMNQYGTPGNYALLSVIDTGTGIDERTRERIFDPFFTTKEVGKGTGLGLAMAYGTIKQHGGFIDVSSVPNQGSTFRIYLPLAAGMTGPSAEKAARSLPSGNELLLLVEDDQAVRTVTRMMLENLGYTVLEACDGDEALRVFRGKQDDIRLVITDIIMPRHSGKDLYRDLKTIKPGVKVLFVSGYTADMLVQKGINEEGLNFISKPLHPETLSVKIREILNA